MQRKSRGPHMLDVLYTFSSASDKINSSSECLIGPSVRFTSETTQQMSTKIESRGLHQSRQILFTIGYYLYLLLSSNQTLSFLSILTYQSMWQVE
jgi:hypothetical protein